MDNLPVRNVISIGLVLLVVVGFSSWKTSEYVGETRRIRNENTVLLSKLEDQEKEIDKLNERLQQVYPGWRPGTPIGNPAGSPLPAGAAPSATPK